MLFGGQPFIADMTALALSRPSKVAIQMRTTYERRARLIHKNLTKVKSITPLIPDAGMFLLVDIEKTNLIKAFQRRYRPGKVDGILDQETLKISEFLVKNQK